MVPVCKMSVLPQNLVRKGGNIKVGSLANTSCNGIMKYRKGLVFLPMPEKKLKFEENKITNCLKITCLKCASLHLLFCGEIIIFRVFT